MKILSLVFMLLSFCYLIAKSDTPNISNIDTNNTTLFEEKKGQLIIPTDCKSPIIIIPNKQSFSNPKIGLSINCEATAHAVAVASGKVVGIINNPTYHYSVIVQHGSYFTVYSKLDTVLVKTNSEIVEGDILGKIRTDDNETSLWFELWYQASKIDPFDWLVKN